MKLPTSDRNAVIKFDDLFIVMPSSLNSCELSNVKANNVSVFPASALRNYKYFNFNFFSRFILRFILVTIGVDAIGVAVGAAVETAAVGVEIRVEVDATTVGIAVEAAAVEVDVVWS